jgi:recombination protein RecA
MSNDELERFLANAANARGSAATAKILSLDELRARRGAEQSNAGWGLAALRGRLVELSARGATATLTAAIDIVAEAQTQAEPVAWFTLTNSTFYPPDVADSGIDLAALVVVRANDSIALARAAERCLRSGAFGLVVLDLGSSGDLSTQIQGRLVTLAQTHDAAILCLTEKTEDTASIGSLVSLRAEAMRIHAPRSKADEQRAAAALLSLDPEPRAFAVAANAVRDPAEPAFEVGVRVLKDKRRGPGFMQTLKRRGPAGFM